MHAPSSTDEKTNPPPHNKRVRIVVPERSVSGGLDFKFESDPYNVDLHGLMTSQDYEDAITVINDTIKPARAGKVDGALLVTGPLLVPLGLWGIRHSRQVKRRKKLLHGAIQDFNANHATLLMRWNKSPDSCLTIERRYVDKHGVPPPFRATMEDGSVGASAAGIGEEEGSIT